MMQMLVIFKAENEHPLAFLLDRRRRHVFCAANVGDYWIVYDWAQGLPELHITAEDPTEHYLKLGYEVLEHERQEAVQGPVLLNNCVGLVKSLCGIRSFALTPHQLYRHLTKRGTAMLKLRNTYIVPGFGGASPPPPPPPPPAPPAAPTKVSKEVKIARKDEVKRAAAAAGQAGTIKTSAQGVLEPARTTKTLI
jgi:hypothetical protein